MKYYNMTSFYTLMRKADSGWKDIKIFASQDELLFDLITRDLWADMQNGMYMPPWATDEDEISQYDSWYPIVDSSLLNLKIIKHWMIRHTNIPDDSTLCLERLAYTASDYGVRHAAAIELMCK